MVNIKWEDKYEIGVKIIDDQHKHFVGLLNALYKCLEVRDTKRLPDIIKDVFSYAGYHFKVEEGYFDKFGYPEADEHKAAHDSLLERAKSFTKRPDKDQIKTGFELVYFLERWLFVHIKGTDQKYVQFFHEHGIK
jgi:hemerythrin-like metal-binding protein